MRIVVRVISFEGLHIMDISVFGQPEISPVLDSEKLRLQYCEAEKRLLVFDYDGTLTPLVKNPEEATLSTQALHSITTLSADPRNSVWIVSGRDQKFLHEQVGHIPELGLSAEHGCFIRKPHSDSWESLIGQTDLTWQTEVTKVFQRFTARTKGSFTERKRVAVTWHYPQADPEEGAHLAQECLNLLEETVVGKRSVVVMPGKANLEVRPTCVNKGSVVTRLVDENLIAPGRQYGYILCAGDDHTDEGTRFPFGSTRPLGCLLMLFQTCSVPFRGTFQPSASAQLQLAQPPNAQLRNGLSPTLRR